MFKKMKTYAMTGAVTVSAVGLSAAPALASDNWYDSISVDSSSVTTVFGAIAGALATIWAVRKVISLLNKS